MTRCMSYGWLAESGISVSSSRSLVGDSQVGGGVDSTRLVEVVGGQVRQQRLHVLDRVLLVGGEVVRVAALGVVGAGAAELLEPDVLAGHRLDDVRPGDEHVARLVDHHGEVGDRGGVDRAAGARAHDERDLRDHAAGPDVAEEDLAVEAQRDDALLDARAAGVVDADDRAADLHGEVHHLDDLLAEDLAERAAEDREVLREDADLAAVDRAVAGDDSVAVRAVVLLAEVGRPVPGQLVELHKRVRVEQQVDAFARGLLAAGVLLVDRAGRAGVDGLVGPVLEVGDLARGRVDVRRPYAAEPRVQVGARSRSRC